MAYVTFVFRYAIALLAESWKPQHCELVALKLQALATLEG